MARSSTNVVALHTEGTTVADACARFLVERDLSDSTRRVYGLTLDKLTEDLGADTPLGSVTLDDLTSALAARYRDASAATFNRQVATIQSLCGWALRRRLIAEDPTVGLERRRERRTPRQAEGQRPIPYRDLEALWSRKDIALREKLLWRLIYETAARSQEVLGLNVEDLDLAERTGTITGKGGHAELLAWATGTARLLPRYLDDRTTGPLFLTDRAPRSPVAKADLDPTSGRARLSYRRAAELFTKASGGRTLHQLRHSAITHLAEEGVDVTLLKAKSRHRSLRSLERYVQPSDASVVQLTSDHDKARRR